jgi:hypothetical protein
MPDTPNLGGRPVGSTESLGTLMARNLKGNIKLQERLRGLIHKLIDRVEADMVMFQHDDRMKTMKYLSEILSDQGKTGDQSVKHVLGENKPEVEKVDTQELAKDISRELFGGEK